MNYSLLFWWWVWALGVYWDDEGWSAYLGPLELRVGRPPDEEPKFDFREDF